jgi:hypothetical protein
VKSNSKNPKDPPRIDFQALLDTGANCNVISNRHEHLFNVSQSSKRRIRFATDDNSQLASICQVKFTIENHELNLEFEAEFYVCNIVEDMILGNPLLKRTGIIYLCLKDSADNPFLPKVYNLEELVGDQEGECEHVESPEDTAFNSDTQDIWVDFAKSFGLNSPEEFFNVIVYYALHTTFPIGDFCTRLKDVVQAMGDIMKHSFQRSNMSMMKRAYHPNAPFKELNKAVEIIINAINMIWDIANIGIAKFRPMDVDFDMDLFKTLHKKQPVQSLNEPMSRYLEDLLNRLRSRNMLRKVPVEEISDITTVSSSYLISKHVPGKFRFIIDMLKSGINGATRPISYPTPDLHEHLDFSAGFDVVSTADGCDFYFQMPVSPASYRYFTIVTKFGYDQFMTLPQGSRNACQHVALCTGETLLVEKMSHTHKCYFDDFHTRANFGQGDLKYFDVLLRLVEFHLYGLRYNIKFDILKAKLCFATLDLLGFTIDKQGKRISASRIDALTKLRKPKSRNDVEKLLGCFVFVAKWIKDFATFTAPLYSLLHKGVRFDRAWSAVHDEALIALRQCVQRAPILTVLNYDSMVYFRSDASLLAIAAVLYQLVDDKELPACYGSKKLTNHQKSWPIVQTEFYALIYFVRKWKTMLQGARVTIEVDARNLLWARNSSNEMIRRWSYEVDSYLDIVKVVHVPGSENEPVDSMSRFVDEDPESKLVVSSLSVSLDMEFSVSVLMADQCGQCDSCVNEIMLTLEEIDNLTDVEKSEQMCDTFGSTLDLECAMTKERFLIISLAHNSVCGHAGVSGTLSLLRRANLHCRRCFKNLSHLRQLVSMFIKACPVCQLSWSLLSTRYPHTEMVLHEYFSHIDLDYAFVGPDRLGNVDVLVARCRFSRFVEIWPTKSTTFEEFAIHLLALVGRYGMFEKYAMDNTNAPFSKKLVEHLMTLINGTRHKLMAYLPQANPAERSVKEVLRHYRALCLCRPEVAKDWSVYSPIVVSVINNTFNATIHTTPTKMMFGDSVDHIRGILTPFGKEKTRTFGPCWASAVSENHSIIMATADAYQIQRLEQCLNAMPDFDGDHVYRPGEYVVSVLPTGMRRPKLNPQFRGLYLVYRTSGNNESTVHCKSVMDETITEIHARDLRPIDLSVLASIDEIRGLAAKLLSVPEWVVSEIQDHRISITSEKPDVITDATLPTLEFLCFYKDMPASESYWWNRYNDLSHLPLLKKYLDTVRNLIPQTGADGRSLHLHSIPSLKVFCRSYGISIGDATLKHEILRLIDEQRSVRVSGYN